MIQQKRIPMELNEKGLEAAIEAIIGNNHSDTDTINQKVIDSYKDDAVSAIKAYLRVKQEEALTEMQRLVQELHEEEGA